jgi:hypothetical protein
MGFLSPMLLGGIGLIAIPIALHLIMRKQPTRQVFPALRFVKQRSDANRQRLRLRQLLLLTLRCLLVAGMALALARPTLQGSGLQGKANAPLAVCMVVDNAPRMQYQHDNRTRLEEAATAAARWVGRLPETSQVAVFDLGRGSGRFALDLSTAIARLRNLKVSYRPRPLIDVIVEAIETVAQRADDRQEVFAFTDLAAREWTPEALDQLAAALAAAPETQLFLVDVGRADPHNLSLGEVELPAETLRPGEPLRLTTSLTHSQPGEPLVVELYLERASDAGQPGELEKRGEQIVALDSATAEIQFELADLPLGTHQGVVKVTAADPLPIDNQRYFTVNVRPSARILLLANDPTGAVFVREALSPTLLVDQPQPFRCDVLRFDQFRPTATSLDDYQAVWLLDPPRLDEAQWKGLLGYAESGGGVGIFLGHQAGSARDFNQETPQKLLPGPLRRRSREETYLRPDRLDHPAVAGLRDYAEGIPWQVYRVYQFWEFEDLAPDTYVIAKFANGMPALIERSIGGGRLLTLATPISDPLQPEGRETWNLLPTGPEPWPFVVLCDQWAGYLSQQGVQQWNYRTGDTARIPIPRGTQLESYVLRPPDGQAIRNTTVGRQEELVISTTELPGNYRITAGGRSQRIDLGFSANLAPQASDLTRAQPDAILSALPAERVHLAANLQQAESYVDVGRSGEELFGWVMGLVATLWAGEHWLANRFYRVVS